MDVFAGQGILTMCPRPDTHLNYMIDIANYMIDIALTTKFAIGADGAR